MMSCCRPSRFCSSILALFLVVVGCQKPIRDLTVPIIGTVIEIRVQPTFGAKTYSIVDKLTIEQFLSDLHKALNDDRVAYSRPYSTVPATCELILITSDDQFRCKTSPLFVQSQAGIVPRHAGTVEVSGRVVQVELHGLAAAISHLKNSELEK